MKMYLPRPIDMWGDFGMVLISGRLRRDAGKLIMDRCGRYVPPVCFPACPEIGVCSVWREDLVQLLTCEHGVSKDVFEEVGYGVVADVNWEKWIGKEEWPPVRPVGGEPSGYYEMSALADVEIGKMEKCYMTRPLGGAERLLSFAWNDKLDCAMVKAGPKLKKGKSLAILDKSGEFILGQDVARAVARAADGWIRFLEV